MDRLCIPIYLLVFFFGACGGKDSPSSDQKDLPYRLNKPDRVYELPEELEEISGLSTLSPTQLLCNEDETGRLYVFNIETATLEQAIPWGEEGDYEGVAVKGNSAYIVKSDGDIFEINSFLGQDREVKKHRIEQLEGCDAEGLCFLPATDVLLLACKRGQANQRSLYAFNTQEGSLHPDPYRQLSFSELEDKLLDTNIDKFSLNLQRLLSSKEGSAILFPSGIAIQPLTRELFVLSAKTKLLAVYTEEGALKNIHELKHKEFFQPESITFTPNGDLYIGNEGKGGKPNILKFVYVEE